MVALMVAIVLASETEQTTQKIYANLTMSDMESCYSSVPGMYSGNWLYTKQTADARPYYEHNFNFNQSLYMYFEKDCDGDLGDVGRPMWVISAEEPSTTADCDLAQDGAHCRFIGYQHALVSDSSVGIDPSALTPVTGVFQGEWYIQCNTGNGISHTNPKISRICPANALPYTYGGWGKWAPQQADGRSCGGQDWKYRSEHCMMAVDCQGCSAKQLNQQTREQTPCTTTTSMTTSTMTSTTVTTTSTTALCNGSADPGICKQFTNPIEDCEKNVEARTLCIALCGKCTNSSYSTPLQSDDDEPDSDKPRNITLAIAVAVPVLLMLIYATVYIKYSAKKQRYSVMDGTESGGMQLQGVESDLLLDENDPYLDLSGDTITIASGVTAMDESHIDIASTPGDVLPPKKRVQSNTQAKFVAPTIRLGSASQAATGLPGLMGVDEQTVGTFLQDGVRAIKQEFQDHGTDEDKRNLQGLLDGSYRNPADSHLTGEEYDTDAAAKLAAPCVSFDELMARPEVQTAGLGLHHVLALRLYTTSSYQSLNNPLRTDPPTQPHPFAATTYFISEGIKKLRAVAAERPDAFTRVVFYRGLRGMGLAKKLIKEGGTEYGCMSTSGSKDVAIEFSQSKHPLIFVYDTENFMARGADISFLSVYPEEKEALYPPLTYLTVTKVTTELLNKNRALVVYVRPTFPS